MMPAADHQPNRRGRTRIGSDDARAWVRKLRLGNPYAKAILMAIANYMNEDGSAYPGLETLHLDTDIADDTIISRLRWCESIGAIGLFKSWIDENGRRNHDGRGRTTSTEIRFLFDADIDLIAENAAAATKPRILRGAALASHGERGINPRPDGEQTEESSPRPDGELNPVSSRLAPDQPPPPAARTEELESKKDSPPYPPSGGDEPDAVRDEEASEIEGWPQFKSEFEADKEPIIRVSIARQLFAALSADERKRVTKAARGLIVWRSHQKKPHAKPSGQTFIREIDAWASWEKHAPPEPQTPKPTTALPPGSDDYLALALMRAIANLPPRNPREHVTFIGDVPAGAAPLAAIIKFDPVSGEVDRAGWTLESKGTDRYVAWSERAKEWIKHWPEAKRFWLDGHGNIVATHAQAYKPERPDLPDGTKDTRPTLPNSKDGLLLPPTPDGFPPPKGKMNPEE